MNFFGKIFGKKTPPPAKPTPAKPSSVDSAKPALIRVHDAYGRELAIPRDQWRDNVLPGNLRQAWQDPEQLYHLILSALNDGFRADIIKAAQHLYKIDPVAERSACLWGIVLREEGRLDEAQSVFETYKTRHGESGVILTNLAKVHAKRGDLRKADQILWHALEIDPNQDNGVTWYEAMHRERAGEEAGLAALRRVADLPASWRARLWLARAALQRRDLPGALNLYREALACMQPIPADALMKISGDLGNTGHLVELLEIVGPLFDVQLHGLQVGNNLIKAYLDLGQLTAAKTILDQLYALNRPDWKATLSFWDTELAKARVDTGAPIKPADLKVAMLNIEGPIWLKPTSPAAELFPVTGEKTTVIAFLGSSVESPNQSQKIQTQLADTRGRFARVIPLFLAEQVDFCTDARSRTLVPWIMGDRQGFALGGGPWADDQAAGVARNGDVKSDYVVLSHLKTIAEPWKAQLRLVRTIDGACVGTAEVALFPDQPEEAMLELSRQVQTWLAHEDAAILQPTPSVYVVPCGKDFPYYLLRLEQLLAVRCEAMQAEQAAAGTLSGEREILDGNLQLCLAHPRNTPVRVLMAQTFWTMKLARPDILPEFKQRVEKLQSEHPLSEPAQSVVQRILNDAFSAKPA